MKKLILLVILSSLFMGCATTYHKENIFGGYSNKSLEGDIYQITFKSSKFTDSHMIELFLHYHCSEIVIEKGYKYYTLLNPYSPTENAVVVKMFNEKPNYQGHLDLEVRDAKQVRMRLSNEIDSYNTKTTINNIFRTFLGLPAVTIISISTWCMMGLC